MAKTWTNQGGLRSPVIGLLAAIGILCLLESLGLTRQTDLIERGIDGFRELKWGTSLDQASKTYPDLGFERHVISNGREEPWKVYVRSVEHGEIERVTFDSIEYWFKRDRLLQVRAVLHSRIGPRTLVTKAENAYSRISARFREQYGDPHDDKVDYVTEFIVTVREATWIVDHSAIVLKYEGAGRTNEDVLTLILQERPGH